MNWMSSGRNRAQKRTKAHARAYQQQRYRSNSVNSGVGRVRSAPSIQDEVDALYEATYHSPHSTAAPPPAPASTAGSAAAVNASTPLISPINARGLHSTPLATSNQAFSTPPTTRAPPHLRRDLKAPPPPPRRSGSSSAAPPLTPTSMALKVADRAPPVVRGKSMDIARLTAKTVYVSRAPVHQQQRLVAGAPTADLGDVFGGQFREEITRKHTQALSTTADRQQQQQQQQQQQRDQQQQQAEPQQQQHEKGECRHHDGTVQTSKNGEHETTGIKFFNNGREVHQSSPVTGKDRERACDKAANEQPAQPAQVAGVSRFAVPASPSIEHPLRPSTAKRSRYAAFLDKDGDREVMSASPFAVSAFQRKLKTTEPSASTSGPLSLARMFSDSNTKGRFGPNGMSFDHLPKPAIASVSREQPTKAVSKVQAPSDQAQQEHGQQQSTQLHSKWDDVCASWGLFDPRSREEALIARAQATASSSATTHDFTPIKDSNADDGRTEVPRGDRSVTKFMSLPCEGSAHDAGPVPDADFQLPQAADSATRKTAPSSAVKAATISPRTSDPNEPQQEAPSVTKILQVLRGEADAGKSDHVSGAGLEGAKRKPPAGDGLGPTSPLKKPRQDAPHEAAEVSGLRCTVARYQQVLANTYSGLVYYQLISKCLALAEAEDNNERCISASAASSVIPGHEAHVSTQPAPSQEGPAPSNDTAVQRQAITRFMPPPLPPQVAAGDTSSATSHSKDSTNANNTNANVSTTVQTYAGAPSSGAGTTSSTAHRSSLRPSTPEPRAEEGAVAFTTADAVDELPAEVCSPAKALLALSMTQVNVCE